MPTTGRGQDRPLWRCPECGLPFLNRNQWHACGRASLEQWLVRVGAPGRRLFHAFADTIGEFGEFHVSPAKTRITFMGQVRFAGITRLTDDAMSCFLALPDALQSERFTSVKQEVPGWFSHRFRIQSVEELDDELRAWLGESYRLMGMRQRLD